MWKEGGGKAGEGLTGGGGWRRGGLVGEGGREKACLVGEEGGGWREKRVVRSCGGGWNKGDKRTEYVFIGVKGVGEREEGVRPCGEEENLLLLSCGGGRKDKYVLEWGGRRKGDGSTEKRGNCVREWNRGDTFM